MKPHCLTGQLKNDEQGFILVLTLLILALLAMLGAIASTSSITEMEVARNERRFNQTFLVADSGWQEASQRLDMLPLPPESDTTTKEVTLADSTPNTIGGIDYSYNTVELGNWAVAGHGKAYRQFKYRVTSTADDNRQGVQVVLYKVWKTGYP